MKSSPARSSPKDAIFSRGPLLRSINSPLAPALPSLAALTAAAAYGVWLLLGGCIVVAIFRLFTSYLGLLNGV